MNAFELKKRRENLGFTQSQLAEKLQMSRKTINSYENGVTIPASKIIFLEQFFENLEKQHLTEKENSDTIIIKNDTNTNNECKETIELLRKQLEQKDKQIESLLNLLNK